MSSKYRFLVHDIFQSQLDDFIESHSKSLKSLVSQIQSAVSDPLHSGKPLSGVQNSKLRGCIRRYHVSGRRGFRLICLIVNSSRKVVLGIFLSGNKRPSINYNKIPWEQYATEIYNDLINSRMDRFKEYRIAD